MYKFVLSTLASLSLIGCGSGDSVENNASSNSSSPVFGSAVPTSYVNLNASIALEDSTQYEWSVRVTTDQGEGEWSSGLAFSIHASEDLALADAVSKDDSTTYEPGLYSDFLPVPTVISSSPVGSTFNPKPKFKWEPIEDAISYEVRILNLDSDAQIFSDTYSAQDICQNDTCELQSTPEDTGPTAVLTPELGEASGPEESVDVPDTSVPTQNPLEVVENTDEIDVEVPSVSEPEQEVIEIIESVDAPEPVIPETDVTETIVPETEVTETIVPETEVTETVVPETEVIVPETEVTETTVPETEVTEPTFPTQPEEEVTEIAEENDTTPELVEATEETPTTPPLGNYIAINAEIEALQQQEGLLAFPGALGYAKNATGGRGGRVVVVNTLEDVVNSSDNLMSLREATTVESGPRTIVFSVGGVFDTGTNELNMSGEADSNVTVACQSAPAPGVTMKTYGFNIQNGAHDVIFRHCAVRLIAVNSTRAQAGRTVTVRGGSRNIMLDHMSFAWATDENFQAYLAPNQAVGIENITVSNSAVVEGDADSAHPESVEHFSWFYHAMGPSCNNNNPDARITNCSIVNNFIAHNATRNAMIWGGDGELKNNVIYNWYGIGLTVQPHPGGGVNAIIDNNLMKSGPNTKGATSNPNCGEVAHRCAMYLGKSNHYGTSRFLVGDNYYIPEYKDFDDVVLLDHPHADTPAGTPQFDSATDSPTPVLEMAARGSRFMSCVGASRPERDHIDTRVIQEFYDGTGSIGIGENIRTGGHNKTIQRTWHLFGPGTEHPAGYDTDNDGMPNEWEIAYGLDPSNPDDHAGDLDSDGYTNLEEYLAIAAHC